MNLPPYRRAVFHWRAVYWLVPMTLLGVSGCGKKEEVSTPPPEVAPTTQQAPPATTVQPAANQIQQQPNSTPAEPAAPDLGQLSREVRRWIVRNQKRPATFEEVFPPGKTQVPPPPAGKKYAIDRQMKVVLVDR